MKILIPNIVPHYVEYDLMQNFGKKIHDNYFQIQYFDFDLARQKEPCISTTIPKYLVPLCQKLKRIYALNKKLEELTYLLYMKEAYKNCTITFHSLRSRKQHYHDIFRSEFPGRDWARIEESLLELGLAVVKKVEERILSYSHEQLKATYEIIMKNETAFLIVDAPNEDALIESLTIIGYSINEGTILKE